MLRFTAKLAGLALIASVGFAALGLTPSAPAMAADTSDKAKKSTGPRVKGFVARRGGYSYIGPDVYNTQGDSRSIRGASGAYRDPGLDRQSLSGPFDHGFFYDSGIAPHGGNSPYMH